MSKRAKILILEATEYLHPDHLAKVGRRMREALRNADADGESGLILLPKGWKFSFVEAPDGDFEVTVPETLADEKQEIHITVNRKD